MFTTSIFITLLSVASCHDLAIGLNTNGNKIFDETKQANPAIWRQANNVTVTANENEVISRIEVKDRRPEKDGDVKIVEGGEGQKNVTIELKSPTALRGYDFQIEVYAIPDSMNENYGNEDGIPKDKIDNKAARDENTETRKDTPIIISKDDTVRSARNSMKETKPSSTMLLEDCVTDVPEDFNREGMKISKDAQDHETVEFVLDTNDSAKEALKAENMTVDLPIEVSENDTEVTSTTENYESTTGFEMTTLKEESKYDKVEPMSDDNLRWNWPSIKDFKPRADIK